eukprot:g2103.t1
MSLSSRSAICSRTRIEKKMEMSETANRARNDTEMSLVARQEPEGLVGTRIAVVGKGECVVVARNRHFNKPSTFTVRFDGSEATEELQLKKRADGGGHKFYTIADASEENPGANVAEVEVKVADEAPVAELIARDPHEEAEQWTVNQMCICCVNAGNGTAVTFSETAAELGHNKCLCWITYCLFGKVLCCRTCQLYAQTREIKQKFNLTGGPTCMNWAIDPLVNLVSTVTNPGMDPIVTVNNDAVHHYSYRSGSSSNPAQPRRGGGGASLKGRWLALSIALPLAAAAALALAVVLRCRQRRQAARWGRDPYLSSDVGSDVEALDGLPAAAFFRRSRGSHSGDGSELQLSFFRNTGASASRFAIDLEQLRWDQEVGAGASAQVFRGKYYGNEVAVKRFRRSVWDQNKFDGFMRAEAATFAALNHPNVVRFFGAAFDPRSRHGFLVTEYCALGSLADLLGRRAPEAARARFMPVMRGVAAGMAYVHSRGFVHRDLKPGNVLLTAELGVKLCDFGLSRSTGNVAGGRGGAGGAGTHDHFTMMTVGQGTPAFMAPELITGSGDESENEKVQGLLSAVDVFSMGVLMWTSWTAHVPYARLALSPFMLMKKITEGMRPPMPGAGQGGGRGGDEGGGDDEAPRHTGRSADANAADKHGYTALISASLAGHTEIAQALVAAGAGVNAATGGGGTALILASKEGHTEVVQAPVAAGAGVSAVDKDGTLRPLEVEGDKPLAWVRERNAQCIAAVGDPTGTESYRRILAILDSKDKIPAIGRIGNDGWYYNFWQDDVHVRGIWRRTTLESYRTAAPEWETVIDVDALPPPPAPAAAGPSGHPGAGRWTADSRYLEPGAAAGGAAGDAGEPAAELTWVWHGYSLLDEGPSGAWDRALVRLSPGGSDADTTREFDLARQAWVAPAEGGFALPEPAKSDVQYRSRDELLIGTDFDGDGSTLTDSGYPRVVKAWQRGTPLAAARTVFEGAQADISASQYAYYDRGHLHEFQHRQLTFYTARRWYRSPGDLNTPCLEEQAEFVPVPVPDDASFGTFGDAATIELRSEWSPDGLQPARTFPAGALLTAPLADAVRGEWAGLRVLFEPSATASLQSQSGTRNFLVLKVLDDVRTELRFWRYDGGGAWTHCDGEGGGGGEGEGEDEGAVRVGEDVSVGAVWPDDSDELWLWRDGYLVPDALELASAADGCRSTTPLRQKPHMFDAAGLTVRQHFARSADGTRVPYFVVRRAGGDGDGDEAGAAGSFRHDGNNCVLLDAYGGFEISMLPGYSAGVGAGWLERGGVKVIANIRGGGEYGPKWHQAALRAERRRAYEDVEAVAADLIERKVTRPARLAVIGGSNGGLMVGNMLTRPRASRLFGAAVCQVPLLDMRRYSHLLAGASWMAEFGDPDTGDWRFMRKFSAYQMLRHDCIGLPEHEAEAETETEADPAAGAGAAGAAAAPPPPASDGDGGGGGVGWRCPKVLFTTSTRDDRVHPGHARKMVRALQEEAQPRGLASTVLYWENTEGGHGGAADNKQRAYMWALSYEFLAQALGLGCAPKL